MSDRLEAGYRRALMMLPRRYWAEHSEEMLGVLMDGAKPGQRRPKAREVLSVATLAVRLRFAVGDPRESGRMAGDIARRAVLAYLIFYFGLLAQWNAFGARVGFSFIPLLLHAGIIASLACGWSLTGRALCVAYGGYLVHNSDSWHYWDRISLGVQVETLIPYLALAAGVLVFHRRAPRLPGAACWLSVWAAITVAFWLRGKTIQHMWEFDISNTPALPALICVAAAIAALWQTKSSPVWPAALALAGFPLLQYLLGIHAYTSYSARNAYYLGTAIGAEVFMLCTALASFLFWAYQRRLPSTGSKAA